MEKKVIIEELKPVFERMTNEEAKELRDRMKKTIDYDLFDYGDDEIEAFKKEAMDWIACDDLTIDYGNDDLNDVLGMLADWEREEEEEEKERIDEEIAYERHIDLLIDLEYERRGFRWA